MTELFEALASTRLESTKILLPSTSPAYAALKFEKKLEAWKAIKQSMVK